MGLTGFNLARRLAEQEAATKAASPFSASDMPPAPESAAQPKRRRRKPTPPPET